MKITVIGGGSSYTPELVEGLIARHASLPMAELALGQAAAGALWLSTTMLPLHRRWGWWR